MRIIRQARLWFSDSPWNLRFQLFFLFIIGGFLIVVSHLPASFDERFVGEIVRDIGIALCIAVIVAWIIELRLSGDTFIRGLDAIMKRTVPNEVWEHFRQHIISQPMSREHWTLKMNIEEQSAGGYVSRTALSYRVVALEDRLDRPVMHGLDRHRDLPGDGRRFKGASLDGKEVPDLAPFLTDDGRTLTLPVSLPKCGDHLEVALQFDELIRYPDTIVWWMNRTTSDVSIEIVGAPETWTIEPRVFHPSRRKFEPTTGNRKWHFDSLLLPGQGFEIRMK